jgi:hypothetical protein
MSLWKRGLIIGLIMLGMVVQSFPAQAQDVEVEKNAALPQVTGKEESPASVTMALQADSFFGFNPSIYGTYRLKENMALAWNFTYWNNISGLGVHDANTWLETDLGVNLTFLKKQLSVTPMVGFVHGMLLSSRGGFFPNGAGSANERTTAFEGVVPSLTANWLSDKAEGEFYVGYYKSMREEGGKPDGRDIRCVDVGTGGGNCLGASRGGSRGSWDFLHWWGNAGYRFNEILSVGGHYEQLLTTRDNSGPTAQQDYYRWIGPYIEAKLQGGMAFRFTAGKDLADDQDFYKLKFTKTF